MMHCRIINLELNDVLLAAFLHLASSHTQIFSFQLHCLAFLKFRIRIDFHLPSSFVLFLLGSPCTAGTYLWLQQGPRWWHRTSWMWIHLSLLGSVWKKDMLASSQLAVSSTAVLCSCFLTHFRSAASRGGEGGGENKFIV